MLRGLSVSEKLSFQEVEDKREWTDEENPNYTCIVGLQCLEEAQREFCMPEGGGSQVGESSGT